MGLEVMADTKEKIISFLEKLIPLGIFVYCIFVPFSIAGQQIGIIVSLVSWGLVSILKRRPVWKNNIMVWPIAAFAATQAVSIIFSIDPSRSLHKFWSYWHILIFFLIASCADAGTVKKGIGLLLASTSAASLLGMFQYVYTRFLSSGAAGSRISGTMGMYMTYSGILMMTAILALAVFLYQARGKKWRLLSLAAACLITFTLILSLTRSAWLGFLAGALVMGIVKDRRILLFLAAGLIAAFFLAPRDVRERAGKIVNGQQTEIKDGVVVRQADERVQLWKSGIEVIKHNPVVGVGLLNFRKAYPQYLSYIPRKNFNHAHNNFINIGAETGLLGLAAMMVMLGVYFVWIVRRARWSSVKEKDFFKNAPIGIMGIFAAFIVAGLFEYNFGDSEVSMLFWFLMAIPFVQTTDDRQTPLQNY